MTLNHTCSFVHANHLLKFDWVDFHLHGVFVFIPIWALHNSLTLGILKGSVGCKNFYFTWGHFSCVLWIVNFLLINDQITILWFTWFPMLWCKNFHASGGSFCFWSYVHRIHLWFFCLLYLHFHGWIYQFCHNSRRGWCTKVTRTLLYQIPTLPQTHSWRSLHNSKIFQIQSRSHLY